MMAKFALTILLHVDYSFKKGICLHLKCISAETTAIHLHMKDTLCVACVSDFRLLALTFSLPGADVLFQTLRVCQYCPLV